MNHAFDRVAAARTTESPRSSPQPDEMLAELLVSHQEMIAQLRAECREQVSGVELLTGMIAQYEQTATMLRAKLEHRAAVRRDPGRTALSAGNFLNLLCLQKSLTAAAARRR